MPKVISTLVLIRMVLNKRMQRAKLSAQQRVQHVSWAKSKLRVDFPGGSAVQETQETLIQSLGREEPLEEGMAAHSSVLAWRIPWTEEPGRLQSTVWQKDMTEGTQHISTQAVNVKTAFWRDRGGVSKHMRLFKLFLKCNFRTLHKEIAYAPLESNYLKT